MTSNQPKVLIVDDRAGNLDALEVMLAPLDCALVRALSADEALFCLLQHDFAVIVLDIKMPGMSGIELAKLIKERKRSQHVPLLFLTAHLMDETDALQGYGVGAVDYLSKPVNADILRSKVGVFLDLFRHSQKLADLNRALEREVSERERAQRHLASANEQLRANEERLAFLLRLDDALRPLNDPGDVQEIAARLLGQRLGASRVGYADFADDAYIVHRGYARGVPPLGGERLTFSIGDHLRAALQGGKTIVVNDVKTDRRLNAADRATLEQRQIAAFIATALFKGGQMIAAFGANQAAPRVWTTSEIELVRDVGERTWDFIERTRAEAAVREQKQRLRIALEASAGGSWTWAAATNHVDWDERFRSLYGFAPEEPATPEAWAARVHEDDRQQLLALRTEMWTSKTKDSWESTFRIVRPDGTVAWIQSRGRVDRDADGNVTRLTGLDLDFSDYQQTELALQARRDEEHDRELRLLLETATQGIVSMDAHGTIVTANRALEGMFGWGEGELIGHRIEELLPPSFRDAHVRHRIGYFAAPRPRLMGGGLDLVGIRKDGSTFPIEVSLNHVPTAGGGRAIAFVTDITERQTAAEALQERTEDLEHRTLQLSRMASDLTLAEQRAREHIARTLHDGLQQLLVIAALNVDQQLKRDSDRGGAPSELLSEARHQLEEALTAARSLNFELFPPVLQRSGLPAALSWLAEWTHDKYKVDVRVHADPRADSMRKDVRTLLFESVRELLFNAVKHAQADRIALELTLDADDQLCITVSDQGIGFDPAGLDYRSTASQVGWGLFSIRERLTLLGGRFDIESAPGKGTRVRLVAPRGNTQGSSEAPAVSTFAPIAAAVSGDSGRASPDALRILLVDDHAAVRKAFREILEQRPQLAVVGEASNGFEAIAHAHTLQPEVILMDISMPHMDGIEATTRIRTELPAIQIFGLSMQPRSAAAEAMEQAGAAGYFVKGIDMQRLIEHLLLVHAAGGNANPASRQPDARLPRG